MIKTKLTKDEKYGLERLEYEKIWAIFIAANWDVSV
jgi:hypothetical protein